MHGGNSSLHRPGMGVPSRLGHVATGPVPAGATLAGTVRVVRIGPKYAEMLGQIRILEKRR